MYPVPTESVKSKLKFMVQHSFQIHPHLCAPANSECWVTDSHGVAGRAARYLMDGRNSVYGIGLLGSISIYTLLDLMSESSIDAVTVTSALGYCLLPMVGVPALSVIFTLQYVTCPCSACPRTLTFNCSGTTGYLLSLLSIAWCTYSAYVVCFQELCD
jgi:hypothetical protein